MGVFVETFGTGKVDDEVLAAYVEKNFDFRPASLIKELDLLRPIYRATAAYGHFGRSEFPWENTKRAAKVAADLLGKSASKAEPKAKAKAKVEAEAKAEPKAKTKAEPKAKAAPKAKVKVKVKAAAGK
jgi:S-adenosylmethionine synthetase